MPKDFSFLEEASKVVVGKTGNFRIQWNNVSLGDNDVIVERPAMTLDQLQSRRKLDVSNTTPAYEKKEHKARCSSCMMWFEKSSVAYKVSNHRLIALREQNGKAETGRRYRSASYMYKFVNVCVFCSQLFDEDYKISSKPEELLDLPQKKEPVVKTELLRMNIASGQKCYMSSVVDSLTADKALTRSVSINGTIGAKSRREADPWWEVDLDSTHHIESVVFEIMGGLQLNVPVVCMLLKKPMGFENPFLGQVERLAVAKEEFTMPEMPQLQTYTFKWKIPNKASGRALRIQLRQIHTLQLLSIQIYQGDEFVAPTEEDLEITKNSFATANLEQFRKAKREFDKEMNVGRPKTTSSAFKNIHLNKHQKREADIIDLNKTMRSRQRATEEWEMALSMAARSFTEQELEALWEYIFAPGHPKPSDVIKRPNTPGVTGRGRSMGSPIQGNRPRSRSPVGDNASPPLPGNFQDNGIKELSVLTASQPAVSLEDIYGRIKHVLYTINMKDKNSTKKLGILCQMPLLIELAEECEEQLHMLKSAIDIVQDVVGSISHSALASVCKWGQFVYMMDLFSQGRTAQIPYIVFNVDKDSVRARNDDSWSQDGYNTHDGEQFAVIHSHGMAMGGSKHRAKVIQEERNQASNDLGALVMGHTLDDIGSPERLHSSPSRVNKSRGGLGASTPNGVFTRSQSSLSGGESTSGFTRSGRPDMTPITTSLRKKGIRPPDGNYFQQFKLNNMVKRQAQIDTLEFPKHLTADFTQLLLEAQSPCKVSNQKTEIIDEDDDMLEMNDEASISSKRSEDTHLSTKSKSRVPPRFVVAKKGPKAFKADEAMTEILTTNPVLGSMVAQSKVTSGATRGGGLLEKYGISTDGSDNKKKKGAFFKRTCALCNVQFPKDSVSSSVIYKHIVTLRRHWDPKLVSKQVILLEQNMSMYNLVPVCVFCSQFFDPDFPGGIALPSSESAAPKQNLYDSIVHPVTPKPERNLTRPQTADGLVVSRPGTRGEDQKSKTINIVNISKRGTVLGPLKYKQKVQKTKSLPVHLLPQMDTRYEIGNAIDKLSSPKVKEKRKLAKESIDVLQAQLRQIEEEQEQRRLAIKASDDALN